MTPDQIADQIQQAWSGFVSAGQRTGVPHSYVYASAWRRCDRRMVLDCTHTDQQPPWSADILARFRRGDDRERDLLADLIRIGRNSDPPFRVHGQQERFELRDHKSRVAIVGKVDARLELADCRPPIEVKAWSPMLVDRIETFADVFTNPFTQSGGYQLLSYLYGAGEPFGFLLLDRSGLPRLLPVELDRHLDRMEAFLLKAERVLDHVEADTLPDYLDDPAECRRCLWYGAVCNPPLSAQQAQILADPELEAALVRREDLKAAAKEFADLDQEVKAHLRGIESAIIGNFQIRGQWQQNSKLDLPADLKKQYTVTNPRGRFVLEVTKL